MKKKIIKITESELRKMVNESINKVIKESFEQRFPVDGEHYKFNPNTMIGLDVDNNVMFTYSPKNEEELDKFIEHLKYFNSNNTSLNSDWMETYPGITIVNQ